MVVFPALSRPTNTILTSSFRHNNRTIFVNKIPMIIEEMKFIVFVGAWFEGHSRFLLLTGNSPLLLADLLTRPAHSIITQSFDSKLRVDRRRPLNGDGFGVGWYDNDQEEDTDFELAEGMYTGMNASANNSHYKLAEARVTVVGGRASAKEANDGQISCDDKPAHLTEDNLMKVYTAKGGPCVFTSTLPAYY